MPTLFEAFVSYAGKKSDEHPGQGVTVETNGTFQLLY